jgi:hypothetical protein
MIANSDIANMTLLLHQKGRGKLIISAPSAFVLEEWCEHLAYVCGGSAFANVKNNHQGKERILYSSL